MKHCECKESLGSVPCGPLFNIFCEVGLLRKFLNALDALAYNIKLLLWMCHKNKSKYVVLCLRTYRLRV